MHYTQEVASATAALYQQGPKVDTSPLTRFNISKKHVRILIALFTIEERSVTCPVYADPEYLQKLVAQISYKHYSYLDIVSFINDLHVREYVDMQKDSTSGQECYKIKLLGVSLLEKLSLELSSHLNPSSTPNFYPTIH